MSNVVIAGQHVLLPDLTEELTTEDGALCLPADESERRSFLDEHGAGVKVAVTSSFAGFDADLMDALPDLELIANFGVGYDSTDVEAARERGITVSNTPDVLNDGVADLGVGLIIDVLRGISASDRFARAGKWKNGAFPLQREVTGRRVGILGLGRIGQEVATRLEGFRCEIGYHNRNEVETSYRYFGGAEELAGWAEVLVVLTPGGAATKALVDADVLAALGPEGYLVNIARGTVVDEDALVQALNDATIAGAGLDVYPNEPHINEALMALDNVVLTPHIASGTRETRRAMADTVLENVRTWLADGRAVTPVN